MSAGGWGQPPGGYGQPPGGYGQPPGGYGQPPGGYGQPPGGAYGPPPGGGYGQPPGGYGQPTGQPPGYGPGAQGPAPGHPGAMGFAPTHPMGQGMSGGVEFGAGENKVMEETAKWAKGVGFIQFVQAMLQLANFSVFSLIAIPVYCCIGLGFTKGGSSLQAVSRTQGNDVPHLMTALDQFGSAFLIRIVCTCLFAGLILIAMVIGVIAAAASA